MILFNFGSSVVMGISTEAAQDSWLALLLAALFTLPIVLMYARIIEINPRLGFFDAIIAQLGKVAGKVVVALMTWYALHLLALVMRNFSEFYQITSLLETPQLPVSVVMLLAVAYLAKCGVKALGKWAIATLAVIIAVVVLTVVLSINVMNFDNVLPLFERRLGEIVGDAFSIFAFPLCETLMFLSIADCIATGDSARKIYLKGMLGGVIVLLIIILRNLCVLGAPMLALEYYPSYSMARIIKLGDFLSRIEVSIAVNFMLAGITKMTLCLIAATKGFARLFDVEDFRRLVVPTALLALALSMTMFGNTMEMFTFWNFYAYYAAPFQVALPALVWVVSEVRNRRSAYAN